MRLSSDFTLIFKWFLPLAIVMNIVGKVMMTYSNIDMSNLSYASQADLLSYSVIIVGLLFYLPCVGKLKSVILLPAEKKIYLNGKQGVSFEQIISIDRYMFIYRKITYRDQSEKEKKVLFLVRFSDLFKNTDYKKYFNEKS